MLLEPNSCSSTLRKRSRSDTLGSDATNNHSKASKVNSSEQTSDDPGNNLDAMLDTRLKRESPKDIPEDTNVEDGIETGIDESIDEGIDDDTDDDAQTIDSEGIEHEYLWNRKFCMGQW
ncbi:hypothetical protein FOVSG1_015221 [Fusarium oxysporum f. sp. vasinfectum]